METILSRVRAWALVAPEHGYVTGTCLDSAEKAATLLADRRANGQMYPGERVVQVQVALWANAHGEVCARVVNL